MITMWCQDTYLHQFNNNREMIMKIPKGANTSLAMKFLGTELGQGWLVNKDYDAIYSVLGEFSATLDGYEISQPEPIVKGIKFMIEEFNL